MLMDVAGRTSSLDFYVAPFSDREIRMAPEIEVAVPEDIYRRRMTHRLLQRALEAVTKFYRNSELDYPAAQEAGLYAIMAMVASIARRPDLATEFRRATQEAIARVTSAPKMRKRKKTGRRKPHPPPPKAKSNDRISGGIPI